MYSHVSCRPVRTQESVAVDGHGAIANGRVVDEGAVVDPSLPFVEPAGGGVPGRHRQPGMRMPRRDDSLLRYSEQRRTEARTACSAVQIQLVDLVVVDHDEPCHAAGMCRNDGVGDTIMGAIDE